MHETRPRADKTADKTSEAQLRKTLQHGFLKHTEVPGCTEVGFPKFLYGTGDTAHAKLAASFVSPAPL